MFNNLFKKIKDFILKDEFLLPIKKCPICQKDCSYDGDGITYSYRDASCGGDHFAYSFTKIDFKIVSFVIIINNIEYSFSKENSDLTISPLNAYELESTIDIGDFDSIDFNNIIPIIEKYNKLLAFR